jgi:hypothetical protein
LAITTWTGCRIVHGVRPQSSFPIGLDAPVSGMIAATALEHNLTVVTRNVKDFAGLGVAVLNPWEAA